jgi:hypothetical protein
MQFTQWPPRKRVDAAEDKGAAKKFGASRPPMRRLIIALSHLDVDTSCWSKADDAREDEDLLEAARSCVSRAVRGRSCADAKSAANRLRLKTVQNKAFKKGGARDRKNCHVVIVNACWHTSPTRSSNKADFFSNALLSHFGASAEGPGAASKKGWRKEDEEDGRQGCH